MVKEVQTLLKRYNAHATFFVCTDYVSNDAMVLSEARNLVSNGHELGNHLREDLSGHYCNLSKEEFERDLHDTNKILDSIEDCPNTHWFRAPQGRMSLAMKQAVAEAGMKSVLGDCYCDDWAFAENSNIKVVAPLMLRQVQESGSIAIFHMPERGFREKTLVALEQFLEGLRELHMQCLTLTEMESLCCKSMAENSTKIAEMRA
jgi:peptidoglycan/xylan/chitin deacetylase (PgdA/CDA1 family)